jgi:hypothetical protein
MALWGNQDAAALAVGTTIAVTNGSAAVTAATASTFTELAVGDVLIITSGTTTKNRVASITSGTAITLADNFSGTTAATLAVSAVKKQTQPKYVYQNGNPTIGGKAGLELVFGIDETEAALAANKAKGITTPGWTRFQTYTDAQSNTRYKTEVLVAAGSFTNTIIGDASDDSVAADS